MLRAPLACIGATVPRKVVPHVSRFPGCRRCEAAVRHADAKSVVLPHFGYRPQ